MKKSIRFFMNHFVVVAKTQMGPVLLKDMEGVASSVIAFVIGAMCGVVHGLYSPFIITTAVTHFLKKEFDKCSKGGVSTFNEIRYFTQAIMRILMGEFVFALVLVFAGKPMIIILVLANVVDYLRFVYQRSKPKPKKVRPQRMAGKKR